MSTLFHSVFDNYFIAFILGIFGGILVFLTNYLIAFSTLTRPIVILRILLSISLSLLVSVLTLLILFDDLITQRGQSLDLIGKITVFQEIVNESSIIQIISLLILIFVFLIELCPLILIMTKREGAYEKIMQENMYFAIKNAQLDKEEELNQKSINIQKREDLKRMPFGGFELYIDYKRLQVNDVNILLGSLNSLYNAIYKIQTSNYNNFIGEEIFKSYPEDTFLIHSIETGNSITFKVTTGWKPKLEVIESDFVISLPKGAVTLLLTGYLVTKIFDYGISSYKGILEIEK